MPVLSRLVHVGPGIARNIEYSSGEYDEGYGPHGQGVRIAAEEPFFPFMARVPKEQAPLDLAFLQDIPDWRAIVRSLCERGFAPQRADVGWAKTLPEPPLEELFRRGDQIDEILGILGHTNQTAAAVNGCEVRSSGADFIVFQRGDGSLFPLFLADIERIDMHWPANTLEFAFAAGAAPYPEVSGTLKVTRRSLIRK